MPGASGTTPTWPSVRWSMLSSLSYPVGMADGLFDVVDCRLPYKYHKSLRHAAAGGSLALHTANSGRVIDAQAQGVCALARVVETDSGELRRGGCGGGVCPVGASALFRKSLSAPSQ